MCKYLSVIMQKKAPEIIKFNPIGSTDIRKISLKGSKEQPVMAFYRENQTSEIRFVQAEVINLTWGHHSDVYFYDKQTFLIFTALNSIAFKGILPVQKASPYIQELDKFSKENPIPFNETSFFLAVPSQAVTDFTTFDKCIPIWCRGEARVHIRNHEQLKDMLEEPKWVDRFWDNKNYMSINVIDTTDKALLKPFLELCFRERLVSLKISTEIDEHLLEFILRNLSEHSYITTFYVQIMNETLFEQLLEALDNNHNITNGEIKCYFPPSEELKEKLKTKYKFLRYYRPFLRFNFGEVSENFDNSTPSWNNVKISPEY